MRAYNVDPLVSGFGQIYLTESADQRVYVIANLQPEVHLSGPVLGDLKVWMMTHPQSAVHLSEPVLDYMKAVNHHTPGVLLIFQDRPSSLAARFTVTKKSHVTSMVSLRLLVSSTVGF